MRLHVPTGLLVAALVLVGCASDDDGSDRATPSTVTIDREPVSGDSVFFDLNEVGEHRCDDVVNDVTISTRGETPPPVAMPDLDLLAASVEIEGERLLGVFELAAGPRPAAHPRYVLFVGLFDDPNAFELHVVPDDTDWLVRLHRAGGTVMPVDVIGAAVAVTTVGLHFDVPLDQLPVIQPNQPIGYGTTGTVIDADGQPTDRLGAALPPSTTSTSGQSGSTGESSGDATVTALDDCLEFVQ